MVKVQGLDAISEICLGWVGPWMKNFLIMGNGISLSLGVPLREVADILEVAMLNFKILEINNELANNGSVL